MILLTQTNLANLTTTKVYQKCIGATIRTVSHF